MAVNGKGKQVASEAPAASSLSKRKKPVPQELLDRRKKRNPGILQLSDDSAEDSDFEDEDVEEDEEEENDFDSEDEFLDRRKKMKPGILQLFDDSAEDADFEDEDEEDDEEEESDFDHEDEFADLELEESEVFCERDDDDIDVTVCSTQLDCPICFQPLELPIFQCTNGHVTCSQCSSKRCHFCSASNAGRCLLLESIIESNNVVCPYAKFGCPITSRPYNQIYAHKKTCSHAPCSCPVPGCNFKCRGLKLSSHVDAKHTCKFFVLGRYFTLLLHRYKPVYVLRGRNNVYVLLNRRVELGSALWIVQVSPGSDKGLSYEIEIANSGMDKSLKLKGFVLKVTSFDMDASPEFFIIVPHNFFDLTSDVAVTVKIGTRKKIGGMC